MSSDLMRNRERERKKESKRERERERVKRERKKERKNTRGNSNVIVGKKKKEMKLTKTHFSLFTISNNATEKVSE